MNIEVDQLLSNSFVISVNDDRYQMFCERFNKVNLNRPLPRLYNGFTIKNGVYKEAGIIKSGNNINCTLSHLALVKMAKLLEMPFICIFEDDASPKLNCGDIIQKYLQDLPDDIDLLRLGHLGVKSTNNGIIYNVKSFGSHAYIVFKKYYDDYLKLSYSNLTVDQITMNLNKHKIGTIQENLFIQLCNYKTQNTNIHNNDPLNLLLRYTTIEYLKSNYIE